MTDGNPLICWTNLPNGRNMAPNPTTVKIIVVIFVVAIAVVLAVVFFNQEPEEELPYEVEYKSKLGQLIVRQTDEIPGDWWFGDVYYEDPESGETVYILQQEYTSLGWGKTSFRIISESLVNLDERTYTVELFNYDLPDSLFYKVVVESS